MYNVEDSDIYKIKDWVINIYVDFRYINNFTFDYIADSLHHELLHLYQWYNKSIKYMIHEKISKIKLIDVKFTKEYKLSSTSSEIYKNIFELKESEYSILRVWGDVLYFLLPEESAAFLNSYYEQSINYKIAKSHFNEYIIQVERVLNTNYNDKIIDFLYYNKNFKYVIDNLYHIKIKNKQEWIKILLKYINFKYNKLNKKIKKVKNLADHDLELSSKNKLPKF